MHPAIIIGTVRSLIVDVAMGQIPRSTERISSLIYFYLLTFTLLFLHSRQPEAAPLLSVFCQPKSDKSAISQNRLDYTDGNDIADSASRKKKNVRQIRITDTSN